jgi:hypothetical protein
VGAGFWSCCAKTLVVAATASMTNIVFIQDHRPARPGCQVKRPPAFGQHPLFPFPRKWRR